MSLDNEILKEFIVESKSLIEQSLEILESADGSPAKAKTLETFGNNVDRIMGGAKNLAMLVDVNHPLYFISDYCAVCKAVGYKGSQIKNNPDFYNICVALLLDATETLVEMIDHVSDENKNPRNLLTQTFLDRLQWVSNQFSKDIRETVGEKSLGQNDIDELLKKLGIG